MLDLKNGNFYHCLFPKLKGLENFLTILKKYKSTNQQINNQYSVLLKDVRLWESLRAETWIVTAITTSFDRSQRDCHYQLCETSLVVKNPSHYVNSTIRQNVIILVYSTDTLSSNKVSTVMCFKMTKCRIDILSNSTKCYSTKCYSTKCYSTKCQFDMFDILSIRQNVL